jgi:hypothetical protein
MSQQQNLVSNITQKLITIIVEEINKDEMQKIIKTKVISPVVQLIYRDLYPYIIMLSITIIMILLFTVLTFMFFVAYYLRK